ncbi:MAG: iron-containing alcohol dehydrogenase [Bacilli bacterium]|jgi:alcohol dehydrogenase YqhD (iron-dependent ADH family)|nr:iron-containing alcohol dehydrogenase [Bacilli bacterium]
MNNFVYYNPTKIIFGKDTQKNVGDEVKKYGKKVLLHYGGGSIKKSGLYDQVIKSLKDNDLEIFELGGVVPNPLLSLINEGIKMCQDNDIDFILAVGGGSVIDSAKAIGGGVKYNGDVWDFYAKGLTCTDSLPVGTILTLPATGTEMNFRSVITKDDTLEKRGASFPNPVFSILNAELCATLPKNQVANGLVDMLAHVFERYFTNTKNVELTDYQMEAVMKSIIELGPYVYDNPADYDKYAQIMWAGTVAHNYSLCVGRETDWATHQIEHELSGMDSSIAHGEGLAVLFPNWMKYVYKHDVDRFVQLAVRVFNVEEDFFDKEKTALKGIDALINFYKRLNMPLTLRDLNINEDKIDELALLATRNNTITQGNFVKLNTDDIKNILLLSR